MPLEQFWEGDAELFYAYRFAYYLRKKDELEETNRNAWLNGMYMVRALWSVNGNIHVSEEHKHLVPEYFNEPIDLFGVKKKKEEDVIIKQKEIEENRMKLLVSQTQIKLLNKNKKKQK